MLTGIPRETVRYKVKKQLRNLGFKIQMIPNFYKMGLTRLYAKLSFSRSGIKIAQKILKELGLNSYLSYYSKIAFSNDYLVLINPPSKWANTFNKLFDELQSEGIVESFSVKEVKEVGYPHVTYRLFDFEKGSWNLSEDEAPNGEGVVVMQKASVDETANYLIDSTDLLILTD